MAPWGMSSHDLTLAEAATQIECGVQCPNCWVTVRLDLAALAAKLGPAVKVGDLRARLKCSVCGARLPMMCTLWLGQTYTAGMVAQWVRR